MVDEVDFDRFVTCCKPLLFPARDVIWVLAGRTESNLYKLKKVLTKHGLRHHTFYLCYNAKQMLQYGHWKRQRGIANSKTLEQALLVYKEKVPKNMPKERVYVDAGSALFNQVVRNVPVLAPKNQAYVPRQVRDESVRNMTGVPHNEDPGEQEKAKDVDEGDDAPWLNQPNPNQPDKDEDRAFVASHVKKRKLYRQLSGTDVPWFPHDNDPELLKELCFEANRPRWVLYGTPAGGAGIHGCFEIGCSVVALCYDDHHRELLETFMLQRAVEGMASGMSMVFKDAVLQARSAELHLAQSQEKAKNEKDRSKKDNSGVLPGDAHAQDDKDNSKKDKKKKKGQDQDGKSKKKSKKEKSASDSDTKESSSAPTPKKSKQQ